MSKLVKPFLKWAGGKTQILGDIKRCFPYKINDKFTFVEPFVGSGAVLFWVLNHFPNVERCVINDINPELINTYQVIQSNVDELIDQLSDWEAEYHQLTSKEEDKKAYYYDKRTVFNAKQESCVTQAALFIFLNRTCFNGLHRVNKSGGFNVPIGSYKKPTICHSTNIRKVSEFLANVTILHGDFEQTLEHATPNTCFYLDPPYKPLNSTSSFNAYAKNTFDDAEQIRLKEFCDRLNEQGYPWVLSNSDVSQLDKNNFFDELYREYSIGRVSAKRSINAIATKRGRIQELLISN